MDNTSQFDIELLQKLREMGATEVTFPNGAKVVFPPSQVKHVDVQAKVQKVKEKVDPDAARHKHYAAILGIQHDG